MIPPIFFALNSFADALREFVSIVPWSQKNKKKIFTALSITLAPKLQRNGNEIYRAKAGFCLGFSLVEPPTINLERSLIKS